MNYSEKLHFSRKIVDDYAWFVENPQDGDVEIHRIVPIVQLFVQHVFQVWSRASKKNKGASTFQEVSAQSLLQIWICVASLWEIPHLVTQDVQKNAIAVPLRMHIFFFIYPSEKLEECCRMKPKQSCCMASPTTVKIRACHNFCNRNGCKVASPQSWTSKDHKDALGGWRS